MDKFKPITSLLKPQDVQAWYQDNPVEQSFVESVFPLEYSESDSWRTLSNDAGYVNEAADPTSLGSKIPVAGREGFTHVTGDMVSFSKGREMTAKDIKRFQDLKRRFAELKNQTAAQQLLDFYGNDLAFVRNAVISEMTFLDWNLISSACNMDFVAGNSPYMQGLAQMQYPVAPWQKEAVGTSWSDPAAEILTDIQNVVDAGQARGKYFTTIFINKKWFTYVRNNEQIKTETQSLVSSLLGSTAAPTLSTINTMLEQYFDNAVKFVVVDDKITRANADGTKTQANPFVDGVAVFAQSEVLGHFEWNDIPIVDARESAESFFVVGNYTQIDPSYSKTYAKALGFPVVDTYADNFYLKVNAIAW